jgi:hypothetical protein
MCTLREEQELLVVPTTLTPTPTPLVKQIPPLMTERTHPRHALTCLLTPHLRLSRAFQRLDSADDVMTLFMFWQRQQDRTENVALISRCDVITVKVKTMAFYSEA